jgi:hypothetical protein
MLALLPYRPLFLCGVSLYLLFWLWQMAVRRRTGWPPLLKHTLGALLAAGAVALTAYTVLEFGQSGLDLGFAGLTLVTGMAFPEFVFQWLVPKKEEPTG